MADNDLLVYCDAGCEIIKTGKSRLKDYFNMVNSTPTGILSFQSNFPEQDWTKMDVFEKLGYHQLLGGQYFGSFFVIRKYTHTISLVQLWYETCCQYSLLDDSPSKSTNSITFKEHRHDQSIWSIIRKKYGSLVFSDEGDYCDKDISVKLDNYVFANFRNNQETSKIDLETLARIYQTDKLSHGYIPIYEKTLQSFRYDDFNMLEIGVFFGSSINMWNQYFQNATIYGADTFCGVQGNGQIFPDADKYYKQWKAKKACMLEDVYLVKLDQSNTQDLKHFVNYCHNHNITFKFIIDDGSHLMHDQQITFYYLFPLLVSKGIYIIEDTHTCGQPNYDVLPDKSNSTKKVFERLEDGLPLLSMYFKDDQKNIQNNIDKHINYTVKNGSETLVIFKK